MLGIIVSSFGMEAQTVALLPSSTRVPGSILNLGYCLYGGYVDVLCMSVLFYPGSLAYSHLPKNILDWLHYFAPSCEQVCECSVCVHGALCWTGIESRVYSQLTSRVQGIGS